MIRLGMIGAGTIFQNQISGLSQLADKYKIVSVFDLNEKNLAQAQRALDSLNISADVVFCSSFEEFMAYDMDAILIATPPNTHFRLALDCLNRRKSVLLEKPAVLSMEELELLYEQAHKNGVLLHVAYHASFAIDLQWYLEHKNALSKTYGLTQISEIYCGFYDPYVVDGQILSGKEKLAGSYIDSAVNEFSVCDRLIDLNGFTTVSHRVKTGTQETVVMSNTLFSNGAITLHLDTGWELGLNRKRTVIQFKGCEQQLVLDHSNQRVILQPIAAKSDILAAFHERKEIETSSQNILLFADTSELRLNRHYIGVFTDFVRAYNSGKTNEESTKIIHKLLIENVLQN